MALIKFTILCNKCLLSISKIFTSPQTNSSFFLTEVQLIYNVVFVSGKLLFSLSSPSSSPPPQPLATSNLLSVPMNVPFLDISYREITGYVAFSDWHLSRSIMFLRSVHVIICITNSFLFMTVYNSIAGIQTFGLFFS